MKPTQTLTRAGVGAVVLALLLSSPHPSAAQEWPDVAEMAAALEDQVLSWRRDFHQHPELSNREIRTAEIVAACRFRTGS